jgi:hypothetical protein
MVDPKRSLLVEMWIRKAAREGIELEPSNFKLIDGVWTLDGMDPDEWLHAMTMD